MAVTALAVSACEVDDDVTRSGHTSTNGRGDKTEEGEGEGETMSLLAFIM